MFILVMPLFHFNNSRPIIRRPSKAKIVTFKLLKRASKASVLMSCIFLTKNLIKYIAHPYLFIYAQSSF